MYLIIVSYSTKHRVSGEHNCSTSTFNYLRRLNLREFRHLLLVLIMLTDRDIYVVLK